MMKKFLKTGLFLVLLTSNTYATPHVGDTSVMTGIATLQMGQTVPFSTTLTIPRANDVSFILRYTLNFNGQTSTWETPTSFAEYANYETLYQSTFENCTQLRGELLDFNMSNGTQIPSCKLYNEHGSQYGMISVHVPFYGVRLENQTDRADLQNTMHLPPEVRSVSMVLSSFAWGSASL